MMQLRPYQAEAKDAVLHEWSVGHQRTLLVLPTGWLMHRGASE